jgi:pyruvate kinase
MTVAANKEIQMKLPDHKTKIVCTIGPASNSPEIMQRLLLAGMNVARINFSHGDFSSHGQIIADLRQTAQTVGRRLAIMADLPGPKIRIGQLAQEPLELEAGAPFTLTTAEIIGDLSQVSVSLDSLPQVVRPGDRIYLNDGLIELAVNCAPAKA